METPNYQSEQHQALCAKWAFTDTLLGGTPTMRQAGKAMLVQFPAEKDPGYNARLAMTTYDNGYADALDAAVGTLLRKPPKLGENVPEQIKRDAEDIDLAGTHFDVFVNRLTRKALHRGAAYVLVDKPALPAETRGQSMRLTDAEALGLRPYWTIYAGPQIQNTPRYVVIDGRVVLQQIVFRECAMVPDGDFGEKEITRYRVYRLPVEQLPNRQYKRMGPVEWQLWEEIEEKDGAGKVIEPKVVQVDGGTLPPQFKTIPVNPCITNPDAEDERQTCGPVFYDLGELSRKDYNQRSDYERSLHICASPIPVVSGMKEADEGAPQGSRAFGPTELIECSEGGGMTYAEPAGTGLEKYDNLLERNQTQMRAKGFETMYSDATVATTATEQLLRAGKRASRMAQILAALHDCLEGCLQDSALWYGLGEDQGGEITMGGAGDELILGAQQLTALQQQQAAGQLSLETFWQLQIRAGILPDDFDAAQEMARIDGEKKKRRH